MSTPADKLMKKRVPSKKSKRATQKPDPLDDGVEWDVLAPFNAEKTGWDEATPEQRIKGRAEDDARLRRLTERDIKKAHPTQRQRIRKEQAEFDRKYNAERAKYKGMSAFEANKIKETSQRLLRTPMQRNALGNKIDDDARLTERLAYRAADEAAVREKKAARASAAKILKNGGFGGAEAIRQMGGPITKDFSPNTNYLKNPKKK